MKDDQVIDDEQRGVERRVFELEQKMSRLLTTTAVTETKVDGLITTIESRFKAFDRGQELILDRLKPLTVIIEQHLDSRLGTLEAVKNKATGALLMVQILGVTGIIGGVIAIIRTLKG